MLMSKNVNNDVSKDTPIVVDIYRDAKRPGIYPPLFTDPEGVVVLVFTKSGSSCSKAG